MINKIQKFSPLIIFLVMIIVLLRGLSLHPNQITSPLLSKPAPNFSLPDLFETQKMVSINDLKGHVTLVNIWASWCYACSLEHNLLLEIAKDKNLLLVGLNYKDDITEARKLLLHYGNPYQLVGVDQRGSTVIDWGMYGTPETFILDKQGIIRYKQFGAITPFTWQSKILPIIKRLQQE